MFDKKVNKFKILKPLPPPKKDEKGNLIPQKAKNLGNGSMTIEFLEKDGKISYLALFRSPTSRPLFTGTIFKNSKIKRVEEKAAKHQLKIAVHSRLEGKLEASFSTINFSSYEDMENFEKEFNQAIKKLQQ